MNEATFFRWFRGVLAVLTVVNAALLLISVSRGRLGDAFGNIIAVALCALAVTVQTAAIRRIDARRQAELRPDYSAIARMEREIYGETFRHEGAPASGFTVTGCSVIVVPDAVQGITLAPFQKEWAKEPKPRRQSRTEMFEDDRRAMRELAAKTKELKRDLGALRQERREGFSCQTCAYWTARGQGSCRKCAREARPKL